MTILRTRPDIAALLERWKALAEGEILGVEDQASLQIEDGDAFFFRLLNFKMHEALNSIRQVEGG